MAKLSKLGITVAAQRVAETTMAHVVSPKAAPASKRARTSKKASLALGGGVLTVAQWGVRQAAADAADEAKKREAAGRGRGMGRGRGRGRGRGAGRG